MVGECPQMRNQDKTYAQPRLGADENLSYKEVSVENLDHQVEGLRNKEFATVMVLWRNHLVERATWEAEEDVRSRYPQLFS